MSSGAKRSPCEDYARDCVRLAQNPSAPPEVRKHLLTMAREWMEQAMVEQEPDGTKSMSGSPCRGLNVSK